MTAPANVTGDRLDRVVAGQLVHCDVPLLSGDTPADGWLEVASVASDGAVVTLTFVDESLFTAPVARLVRIGSN